LASCGWDRSIRIWNTTSGGLVLEFNSSNQVIHTLAAFKNGNLAGSVYYQKHIFIWNTESGNLLKKIEAIKNHVSKLILLESGLLVSTGRDNRIKIWDPNTGVLVRNLLGHSGKVNSLAQLESGYLASGGEDETVIIWNANDGKKIGSFALNEPINVIQVLKNGCLAIGTNKNKLKFWDTKSNRLIQNVNLRSTSVHSLALLPNGYLASAAWDNNVTIWKLNR
jgi:WD40 repeat protein